MLESLLLSFLTDELNCVCVSFLIGLWAYGKFNGW